MNSDSIRSDSIRNDYIPTTLDNRGAPLWLSLDPRESQAAYARRHRAIRHGRIRRAVLAVGALVAAILLAVLIALEARAAAPAATDRPGRPAYMCRWRLVAATEIDTRYAWVCRKVK